MDRTIDMNPEGDRLCSCGEIRLHHTPTWDGKWLDFWATRSSSGSGSFSGTIAKAAAIELRDALLEVYPVETAPKQVTSYTVEEGTSRYYGTPEWRVFRNRTNVPITKSEQVAACHDETTAREIAAALES